MILRLPHLGYALSLGTEISHTNEEARLVPVAAGSSTFNLIPKT